MPVRQPTLRLVSLPDAEKAEAVCNDGSPATFYVRRGLPNKDDHWIVFLAGEGVCTDAASCKARAKQPRATTSEGLPPRRGVGGIFDGDTRKNPDFAGFTQIYVPYCSSDEWLGNRAASQDTGGYHFRGHRILKAVVETLKRKRDNGPNLADAKRLVLAGAGSGGFGVVHNIDAVASWLPGVEVVGVVDGPPTLTPLSSLEATKRRKLWQPEVDASCAQQEASSCLDARALLMDDHVERPIFLRVALQDMRAADSRRSASGDAEAAPKAFTDGARALLEKQRAGFGPDSGHHVTLVGPRFFEERIDESLATLVGRFVFGRDGAKKAIAKP